MAGTVSNQNNKKATNYCKHIANEVTALDELIMGASWDDDLSKNQRELWRELASQASSEPECYKPSLTDYINGCLELVAISEWSSATREVTVTGVRLVVTVGGPNVFVEWNGSSHIVVETYWGNEFAAERVFAPAITSALQTSVTNLQRLGCR